MANDQKPKMRIYVLLSGGAVLALIAVVAIVLVVQDRTDRRLTAEIERTQSELLGLGGRITAIKDADLTSADDYIAAYAQIEPLQKRLRREASEVQ
jgi:hypothetical protein